MRTDIRPAGGWGCLLRLLILPFLLAYALLMSSCNKGPGCNCNCKRTNSKGQVIGGCAVSNHCCVCSNGCHQGC